MSEHTLEELRARIDPTGTFFEVPAGTRESECRSCDAGIYWVRSTSGKAMPIDCYVNGGAIPTATETGRGVAHFATCPQGKQWSRRT